MQTNTLMRERLSDAINNKDTSLISTEEAARLCGLAPSVFTTAHRQRWPDVLKYAKREGKRKFYRVCDVEHFKQIMASKRPLRKSHNDKQEQPVESNTTIASLIASKVKIEKDILVLQEAHQHICKAIQHLRK